MFLQKRRSSTQPPFRIAEGKFYCASIKASGETECLRSLLNIERFSRAQWAFLWRTTASEFQEGTVGLGQELALGASRFQIRTQCHFLESMPNWGHVLWTLSHRSVSQLAVVWSWKLSEPHFHCCHHPWGEVEVFPNLSPLSILLWGKKDSHLSLYVFLLSQSWGQRKPHYEFFSGFIMCAVSEGLRATLTFLRTPHDIISQALRRILLLLFQEENSDSSYSQRRSQHHPTLQESHSTPGLWDHMLLRRARQVGVTWRGRKSYSGW